MYFSSMPSQTQFPCACSSERCSTLLLRLKLERLKVCCASAAVCFWEYPIHPVSVLIMDLTKGVVEHGSWTQGRRSGQRPKKSDLTNFDNKMAQSKWFNTHLKYQMWGCKGQTISQRTNKRVNSQDDEHQKSLEGYGYIFNSLDMPYLVTLWISINLAKPWDIYIVS